MDSSIDSGRGKTQAQNTFFRSTPRNSKLQALEDNQGYLFFFFFNVSESKMVDAVTEM